MQAKPNKESAFTIVQIQQSYPFGLLTELVGKHEQPFARKKLVCPSQQALSIIQEMIKILKNLNHEYLINFHHFEESTDNTYYFYYQYAPLTLDKWILDLGDEILEQLKLEMLNLTFYLTERGIKFLFDPDNVGLSKDIKIKYFLKDFSIDTENKFANYKETSEAVVEYFTEFKKRQEKQENINHFFDRKSADSALVLGSFTARQSWEAKSSKSAKSNNMPKLQTLNEKVQSLKKKSQNILLKLKGLKGISE